MVQTLTTMRMKRPNGSDALAGVVAGTVGTAAMTVLMNPGLAGMLPRDRRPRRFVPREIVQWVDDVLLPRTRFSRREEKILSAVAHVAYGAAMGGVYGLLRRRMTALSTPAAGALWGLAVWAAGYEGWMPLLGVRPATTDEPPRGWPVPIANHVLYGITTAALFERLRRGRSR